MENAAYLYRYHKNGLCVLGLAWLSPQTLALVRNHISRKFSNSGFGGNVSKHRHIICQPFASLLYMFIVIIVIVIVLVISIVTATVIGLVVGTTRYVHLYHVHTHSFTHIFTHTFPVF